jgi:hypothetical protein
MRPLTCWLGVALIAWNGGAASAQAVGPAGASLWKQPRYALKDHRDVVWSATLSSDDKLMATASHDWTVKIWAAP